jgi:hypothetical protein
MFTFMSAAWEINSDNHWLSPPGSRHWEKVQCSEWILKISRDIKSYRKEGVGLKQLRPIGKGEQVLEKRLDKKELT